jgi:hypothetical protein
LERKPTQGQRTSVAAVLSDSKGNYLKQQVVRVKDRAIYWWCQAGDNQGYVHTVVFCRQIAGTQPNIKMHTS